MGDVMLDSLFSVCNSCNRMWDMAKKSSVFYLPGFDRRGRGPPSAAPGMHAATYLTQTDGVVESLSPGVEVHSLPHLLLALVLPGQVVGRSPVSSLIGYFRGLERHQGDHRGSGSGFRPPHHPYRPDSRNTPTFWMLPWKQ